MINNLANHNLLIVDDEPAVISSLERAVRKEGYIVYCANSGKDGLEILKEHDIGVVLSDVMMPEMDGVTFLELSRKYKPDIVKVLLTAHASLTNAVDAINRSKIFAYLTKPWTHEELKECLAKAFNYYNLVLENRQLHNLTENQNRQLKHLNENLENIVRKRTGELREAVREGVTMLASAAEAKDDDTGEHVDRIKALTLNLCLGMKLPLERSEEIGFSSILHDVGKIHIPDAILKKKGPLTSEEFAVMKTHTTAGEKILGNSLFYKVARDISRSHHECWDGSGYPDGLQGESIPLEARIVAVVDVFDALTHARPYKEAWPEKEALQEMQKMSALKFDPDILTVFLTARNI